MCIRDSPEAVLFERSEVTDDSERRMRSSEAGAALIFCLLFHQGKSLSLIHILNEGMKNAHFLVNGKYNFRIEENMKVKNNPGLYYAVDKVEVGEENMIRCV